MFYKDKLRLIFLLFGKIIASFCDFKSLVLSVENKLQHKKGGHHDHPSAQPL